SSYLKSAYIYCLWSQLSNSFMKKSFVALLMLLLVFVACNENKDLARVLVFSKTTGYRHASIANGKVAIQNLGKQNGFNVDTTENAELFNETNLKKYAAVIFLCTTQEVLNDSQEVALERFIQA